MDCLRPWPRPVIQWTHKAINQYSVLVVEYADFQNLVSWWTQASGFSIEIDCHFLALNRAGNCIDKIKDVKPFSS